jgi:hypothetical protein
VVYADKEVVDMLEDKDAEITRLRAETKKKDALLKEAREALERFVAVDDADKSGEPLLSCQGQGMDGYTKLANYESCTTKARPTLASLRKKEGGRVLCETCADKNQCSGVGSKKTECAIYREGK